MSVIKSNQSLYWDDDQLNRKRFQFELLTSSKRLTNYYDSDDAQIVFSHISKEDFEVFPNRDCFYC